MEEEEEEKGDKRGVVVVVGADATNPPGLAVRLYGVSRGDFLGRLLLLPLVLFLVKAIGFDLALLDTSESETSS